jgi:hypothetical protein
VYCAVKLLQDAATRLYSTVQPKFFAYLFAGETRTAFRNGLFGQVPIFQVLYIALDKFAGELALGASGTLGEIE